MKYLIDTCVASESAKRQPSPAVLQWFASVPAADVFLPSVSLGELHKGIARLAPNDSRRPRLTATALANGMTLVTRNVDDMAGMGVPIFNPFTP